MENWVEECDGWKRFGFDLQVQKNFSPHGFETSSKYTLIFSRSTRMWGSVSLKASLPEVSSTPIPGSGGRGRCRGPGFVSAGGQVGRTARGSVFFGQTLYWSWTTLPRHYDHHIDLLTVSHVTRLFTHHKDLRCPRTQNARYTSFFFKSKNCCRIQPLAMIHRIPDWLTAWRRRSLGWRGLCSAAVTCRKAKRRRKRNSSGGKNNGENRSRWWLRRRVELQLV